MDPFDLRLCPIVSPLLADAGTHPNTYIDQVAIDSRRIHSQNALFIALPGARDGHQFVKHAAESGARYAIVHSSFHHDIPNITLLRTPSPLQALQSLAAAYRSHLRSTVFVAIAGSYGKTMLKDLLAKILKARFAVAASPDSFNSQIGVPLSIFTVNSGHSIALIEAASSKPGEMAALEKIIRPDCGIVTHFGKKHLHTMGDEATIVREILILFQNLPSSSWLIAPENHPSQSCAAQIIPWSKPAPNLPHAKALSSLSKPNSLYEVSFPELLPYTSTIPSEQHYFLDLINFAAKAAWLLGAKREDIVGILESFVPEPSRTEIWQSSLGATFINDSSCSDPLSIDISLGNLLQSSSKGRSIFVFSGLRAQNGPAELNYRRVGQALRRYPVSKLYLVGSHPFQPLIDELQNMPIETTQCSDYEEAISLLRHDARHDDVILLKGSNKLPFHVLAGAFADASCSNLCMINLAAIEWNIKTLRKHLPQPTRLMVMVKAQAYGSDSIRIARFLHSIGIDILGVSYVDEGVMLRRAGITTPIFVINAPPHEASKIVKWNLEAGVSSMQAIQALHEAALGQMKTIPVHLHVDTGMSRFGCRPEDALEIAKAISSLSGLKLEGIMTHFATADDQSQDHFTKRQIQTFDACIAALKDAGIDPPWKHAANSASALRFQMPQYNMARIGLAAWGLHSSEATLKGPELRLALSLISHIEGINICKKGESVSYGRTYTIEKEQQTIAVLPIGYFDGLHRHYSGKAHVMIRGQPAPMVGSICMDYMMVDITDIPEAQVGDPVLIFGTDQYGQSLPPENLAKSGNSIAHELITCLGPRIPRVFIYEEVG